MCKETKKGCAIAIKQRFMSLMQHMNKASPFQKVMSLNSTDMRHSDCPGEQGFLPGMIVKLYPKCLLSIHVMDV